MRRAKRGNCKQEITEEVVLMSFDLTVKGAVADDLLAKAAARNCEPAELICRIIEFVLRDNLIDAVIDG